MWTRIAVIGLSALVASCANVIWVKEKEKTEGSETKKVAGIPFYVKTEKLTRKSIYAQTWLRATLEVERTTYRIVGDKKIVLGNGAQTFERQLGKEQLTTLNNFQKRIVDPASRDIVTAEKIIRDFVELKSISDFSKVPHFMIANARESTWVVDSSKTYYLNAPLPWFGSGSLTQELHTDGTLAKAGSSADTKVADSLSTLIPFKEYLTGRFVSEKVTADTENEVQMKGASEAVPRTTEAQPPIPDVVGYELSLSIDEIGYEYTILAYADKEGNLPSVAPWKIDGGEFTRKNIGGDEKAGEEEDGQKVSISGTIMIPKEEPKATN